MLVGHLLKRKKEFKSLKKQEIQAIFTNELDKACFQHDMAYGDFEDIMRKTAAGKVLRDLILLKILNIMDIKEDLFL